MLIYVPENLSVDEAKAIAVRVLAIAYDQEETKICSELRSRQSQFQSVNLNCNEKEIIQSRC